MKYHFRGEGPSGPAVGELANNQAFGELLELSGVTSGNGTAVVMESDGWLKGTSEGGKEVALRSRADGRK